MRPLTVGAALPADVPVEGPGISLVSWNPCTGCPPPAQVIADVTAARVLLEDFVPVETSLDWRLGQMFFAQRGNHAFLSGDVPFVINNDGYLSKHSAELLFTALAASEQRGDLLPTPENIHVLELGAGSGLFARLFLNSFRDLCRLHRKDYHERLRYLISDDSPRMLEDIQRHGLLAGHAQQVRLARIDAASADLFSGLGGEPPVLTAVFLNYLLDALPASAVRRVNGTLERLYVRTYLAQDARLADFTPLSPPQVAEAVQSGDSYRLEPLIDLYPMLQFEYEFRPVQQDEMPYSGALEDIELPEGRIVVHNYGAIRCLEQLAQSLLAGGFVLFNDYAQTEGMGAELNALPYQRFGGSTAIALNLDGIKRRFDGRPDLQWLEPKETSDSFHSRLLGREVAEATAQQFSIRFSKTLFEWTYAPLADARRRLREGRYEAALAAFSEALRRQSENWTVAQESARALLYANQPDAARKLAEAALVLNPVSHDAWNTLGDVLFASGQNDQAHRAFLQALHVYSADATARLNLVYTLTRKGDLGGALQMIADAFVFDRGGELRERLLERQNEILERLRQRSQVQSRLMADRLTAAGSRESSRR